MNLLALDARWRRLQEKFGGVFDIGFDMPSAWPHAEPTAEAPEVSAGEDRLAPELCRLGEARFLHAILPLPIRGSDEVLYLAPWAEVPSESFYAYLDHISDGAPFTGSPARLANDLPLFPGSLGQEVTLEPGGEGARPLILATDGPLAEAQDEGISLDQLIDLYAAAGQDIRQALAADEA
ncbi:hypothetical protein SAMN06297129_2781 [Pseudooceanicola antarcticus]|uniref:DUF2199 domain-containing protein n=1 Tax=Pseudooceanicola antarcticus TaxID=1247613 RepID=A0A285J303_9RHOB|nr:DUF2199 domain-containing protein [Pseudooceanicola antarcticus]PJE29816.1 DUF2199 domain-containing protein [Pseudooceanicola antarcticus]SNY54247.1 hypothetical protein SAMN06297129_2781 [Pseudooceanicola antarcticus]